MSRFIAVPVKMVREHTVEMGNKGLFAHEVNQSLYILRHIPSVVFRGSSVM